MTNRSIDERLHDHGHRATGPRRLVWQALVDLDDHVTVEQLAERVAESDPSVNLASIYRSLALFRDLGLVRESRLGPSEVSYWEPAHPDEHFHLVCTSCGTIDHHVGTLVSQIEEHLISGHDFQPQHIEIVVRGLCPSCRP